jgi:hypothetical protein
MKIDEALVICVTTFFRRKVGNLTTRSQQTHIWPHPKKLLFISTAFDQAVSVVGLKTFKDIWNMLFFCGKNQNIDYLFSTLNGPSSTSRRRFRLR